MAIVYLAYDHYAIPQEGAVTGPTTSTGVSSGSASASPSGQNNNKNKDKKNTAKNSNNKPYPRPSETIDNITKAKIDDSISGRFTPKDLTHTLGHKFGSPGSGTKFPINWTAKDIETAALLVANKLVEVFGEGPNTSGRAGIIREGIVNGVMIKTVVIADRIITSYPVKKFLYIIK